MTAQSDDLHTSATEGCCVAGAVDALAAVQAAGEL